jgi:hypothetical protein
LDFAKRFGLTGAEVDETAGLLTLRERRDFTVLATAETLAALHPIRSSASSPPAW